MTVQQLSERQREVLELLNEENCEGLTVREISETLSREPTAANQTINELCSRFDAVEASAEKRKGNNGPPATVWIITEEGERLLEKSGGRKKESSGPKWIRASEKIHLCDQGDVVAFVIEERGKYLAQCRASGSHALLTIAANQQFLELAAAQFKALSMVEDFQRAVKEAFGQ